MWVLSKTGQGGMLVDCSRFEIVLTPGNKWVIKGWEVGWENGETLAEYESWEKAWKALLLLAKYAQGGQIACFTWNIKEGDPVVQV